MGRAKGARRLAGGLVAVAAAAGSLVAATSPSAPTTTGGYVDNTGCARPGWVTSWAMPPSDAAGTPLPAGVTLRELVYPSLGGTQVRVRLSDRFSTSPVVIGAASVGRQAGGAAAVVPGSFVALRFAGRPGVTIAPGEDVTSDPAPLRVAALEELSVSIYLAAADPTPTEHFTAMQSNYRAAGNRVADASGTGFSRSLQSAVPTSPFSSETILAGLDVLPTASDGAVVALGDSLTDSLIVRGTATNARWPDALARRLAAAGIPLAVVNAGISGNHVLSDATASLFGVSAEHRFDADVVSQAGARTVILFEGINDIGMGRSAEDIEAGDLRLIALAHAAHLRILLATLTPTGRYGDAGLGVGATRRRLSLNIWIRSQHAADGVIDFDPAVADRVDPTDLAAADDGGDHLHLSVAGYAALAGAVPLPLLLPAGCVTG